MELTISRTGRGCNIFKTIIQGSLNYYNLGLAGEHLQKQASGQRMSLNEKQQRCPGTRAYADLATSVSSRVFLIGLHPIVVFYDIDVPKIPSIESGQDVMLSKDWYQPFYWHRTGSKPRKPCHIKQNIA